jgi:signal transduction histidine kinase
MPSVATEPASEEDVTRQISSPLLGATAAAPAASDAASQLPPLPGVLRNTLAVVRMCKTASESIVRLLDQVRGWGEGGAGGCYVHCTRGRVGAGAAHSTHARVRAHVPQALDFEKIDQGKLELELAPVSLVDVLRDVVDQLGVRAKSNRVKLRLLLDGFSPASPVWASLDHHRLVQAVLNLGTNAVKFVRHDGAGVVLLRVSIKPAGLDASAAMPASTPTYSAAAQSTPKAGDDDDAGDGPEASSSGPAIELVSSAPTLAGAAPELIVTSGAGAMPTAGAPIGQREIVIAVVDNGVGMEKANLDKLFTPFVQVRGGGVSEWQLRRLLRRSALQPQLFVAARLIRQPLASRWLWCTLRGRSPPRCPRGASRCFETHPVSDTPKRTAARAGHLAVAVAHAFPRCPIVDQTTPASRTARRLLRMRPRSTACVRMRVCVPLRSSTRASCKAARARGWG